MTEATQTQETQVTTETTELERLRAHNLRLVAELKEAREELQALKAGAEPLRQELKAFKLADARKAFYDGGGFCLPQAHVDLDCPWQIDMDADGNPIFVDGEGKPVREKITVNGMAEHRTRTPLNTEDVKHISQAMRESAPWLFPRPVGGGAQGGGGSRHYTPKPAPEKPASAKPGYGLR